MDDDGDQITSLVLNDEGREVREDAAASDPDLASISRLTENHSALWQAIRSRTANGEGCTRSLVRDDMRAMGFDVNKKFTRWLDKLEKDGLIAFEGERITPLSQRNKVGIKRGKWGRTDSESLYPAFSPTSHAYIDAKWGNNLTR